MTSVEMKSEFLTRYDAASSGVSPGWEDSEISEFLNIGQFNIVNTLYTSQRLDLLAEIVVQEFLIDESFQNTFLQNVIRIVFPDALMYYIDCTLKLHKNVSGDPINFYTSPENITYQQYRQFITTPENRTLFRQPKAYIHNGALNIILDSISSINIKEDRSNTITYIKNPRNIKIEATAVDCELNVGLHKLVVEEAVNQAIKAVSLTKVKSQ
jgi:hypothetical protein